MEPRATSADVRRQRHNDIHRNSTTCGYFEAGRLPSKLDVFFYNKEGSYHNSAAMQVPRSRLHLSILPPGAREKLSPRRQLARSESGQMADRVPGMDERDLGEAQDHAVVRAGELPPATPEGVGVQRDG